LGRASPFFIDKPAKDAQTSSFSHSLAEQSGLIPKKNEVLSFHLPNYKAILNNMRDLNYQLKGICNRNKDGSYSTQAARQRNLGKTPQTTQKLHRNDNELLG
jgi:hypothetical protein